MGIRNPSSIEQVADALGRMGEIDIAIKRLNADCDEAISTLKKVADTEERVLKKERVELKSSIASFMKPRRKSFLSEWGQKSARLWSGVHGWRLSSHKISITKGMEPEVAKSLEDTGLEDGFEERTTFKFKRDFLKNHIDEIKNIPGIKVSGGSRESYFAEPDVRADKKPK